MLGTAWSIAKTGSITTVACYGVGAVFTTATGGLGTVALAGGIQSLSTAGDVATWAAGFAPEVANLAGAPEVIAA